MELIKKYWLNAVTILGVVVWGWIQKGAELEFKEKVGEVIENKVNSKDFMDKVMTSEYMKEYKEVEKLKTLKEVVKVVDSEKIDFIEVLSLKTGLTKEAITDSLSVRISEKKLSEGDIVELIRKYNRRMARL